MLAKWLLLLFWFLLVAIFPVLPQNDLYYPAQNNGPFNSADSSSCILVINSDSTLNLLLSLEKTLVERGKCLSHVPDSLVNKDVFQDSQLHYSLFQQDSLLLFGYAPTLPANTPLWNVTLPYLPEMEHWTEYRLQLDSTIVFSIPLIIDLAEGQIDSTFFENCTYLMSPLLLRAAFEYHKIAKINSTNNVRDVYSEVADCLQDSSILSAWLLYNYASIIGTEKEKEYYIKADSIFNIFNDQMGQALCQLALVRIEDNFDSNKLRYSKILDYCDIYQDSVTEAKIYLSMAELSKKSGHQQTTATYVEKAAQAHESIGDVYQAMLLYTELGEVERNSGHAETSDGALEKALHIAESMQSEANIIKIHYQLAQTKSQLGNVDAAIDHYNASADLMEIFGDKPGLAKVDNKLGTIYLARNEYELARVKYESALNLYKEINDSGGILQSHFNLGELAADLQQWEKSQFHFNQALDIARDLASDRLVGSVLYSKGIAYIKEGKYIDGYDQVKESFDLTDGSVYGTKQESQKFLSQLQTLIKGEKEILSKKKAIEREL